MARNLVICTDGTWNKPDQMDRGRVVPSNVVKLARALSGKTSDGVSQHVYYDTGVGTGGWWDRVKGGAFGIGLMENVKQAYHCIGTNFEPGDRLFLFGFSRGAYTARSLAGLIGLCGIPDRDKGLVGAAVDSAVKVYRMPQKKRAKREAREASAKEHISGCSHMKDGEAVRGIGMVGVWDTVGALGIPLAPLRWVGGRRRRFHDVTLGSHIESAYHALAIDERRRPFRPTLWCARNVSSGQMVEQVWFPGVHTNIGGGYVDAGLSDRALLWMCLKAVGAGLGFRKDYMRGRVDPNLYGELRNSMKRRYRPLGTIVRPIGTDTVAGEYIHYSARQRVDFATEAAYRERARRSALQNALDAGMPLIAPSSRAETAFHSLSNLQNWNDGGGSATRLM